MGIRNLSMPTMQNICQSGWLCKLITSCWSPPLRYCFKYFQLIEKNVFIRILYKFLKTIMNFYSFVTCLLIYLFIC